MRKLYFLGINLDLKKMMWQKMLLLSVRVFLTLVFTLLVTAAHWYLWCPNIFIVGH